MAEAANDARRYGNARRFPSENALRDDKKIAFSL
jgi:hypothetical protein